MKRVTNRSQSVTSLILNDADRQIGNPFAVRRQPNRRPVTITRIAGRRSVCARIRIGERERELRRIHERQNLFELIPRDVLVLQFRGNLPSDPVTMQIAVKAAFCGRVQIARRPAESVRIGNRRAVDCKAQIVALLPHHTFPLTMLYASSAA